MTIRRLASTLMFAAVFAACGGEDRNSTAPAPGQTRVAAVSITPDTVRLTVGQSGQVTVTPRDSAGNALTGRRVAWSSSNPAVATIDSAARVTAVSLGATLVRATVEGISAVAQVVVTFPSADSARLGQDSVTVRVGSGTSATLRGVDAPAGTVLALAELTARPTALPPGAGTGWQLTIQPPASPAGSTGILVPLRLTLDLPGEAPTVPPGDTLAIATTSSAGGARDVSVVRTMTTQRITLPTGIPATRVTATVPVTAGSTQVALARVPTLCNISDPATRLYRVGRSAAAAPDPDRPALVLIHGWQQFQNSCAEADAYRPERTSPWQGVVQRYLQDALPVGDRLSAYETWVMKYPTFQRVDFAAAELNGLLQRFLPNRRVILVAHSMGGLVAARYLVRFSDTAVRHLVTLGTPFAGSPMANTSRRSALRTELQSCSLLGFLEPFIRATISDDSPGYLDLSDAETAFPRRVVLPTVPTFASRVTALYGEIADESGFDGDLSYRTGRCAIAALRLGASDGLVPVASANANNTAGAVRRLFGYDHSAIYGPRLGRRTDDPQEVLADLLRALAAQHAPVASVGVPSPSLTVQTGAVIRLTAEPRDAAGNALAGREVRWRSSNAAVAVVDAITGEVRAGIAPGVATVTASAEGKSADVTVNVQTSPGGPTAPAGSTVAAVITREPVGPDELVPFRMVVLNDRGIDLERAQFTATTPSFVRTLAATLPDSGRCGSLTVCTGGDGISFGTARVLAGQLRAVAVGFAVETFPRLPSALSVSGTLRSAQGDAGASASGGLASTETPVIAVDVDSSSYAPGSTVSLTARIANATAVTLAGMTVVLDLPTGVEFVSALPMATVQARSVTWTLASLPSAASQSLSLQVRVPTTEGMVVLAPELRLASASVAVARARALVPVTTRDVLPMQVTTTQGVVTVGGSVSATVRIRNRSTRTITGVRVSMIVPDETTTRSTSIPAGGRCGPQTTCDAGAAVTWPTTSIRPGGELSYSLGFAVDVFPRRRTLAFEIVSMATYDGGGGVHSAVVTRTR